MATLYENQLHDPIGPFASFFSILDKKKQGFVTQHDLQSFLMEHPDVHVSFVQKQYLSLLIRKGFSKLQRHPSGHLTIEDISCYAQRLLTFFCGVSVDSPQQCIQGSQQVFQCISSSNNSIHTAQLHRYIIQRLPTFAPNKNTLAHILTQSVFVFCSQTQNRTIKEKRWTDTALALYFEMYRHT